MSVKVETVDSWGISEIYLRMYFQVSLPGTFLQYIININEKVVWCYKEKEHMEKHLGFGTPHEGCQVVGMA